MTALELLNMARAEKPHIEYTTNKRGDAIAARIDGKWIMVAGLLIDGQWASMGNLIANGEPVCKDEDWLEPETETSTQMIQPV